MRNTPTPDQDERVRQEREADASERSDGPEGTGASFDPSEATTSIPEEEIEWQKFQPTFILIAFLRILRGMFFPIVILLVSGGLGGNWFPLALSGVFAVGAVVAALYEWRFSRYAVTEREAVLRTGLISRQERVVPFERIQSVDLLEAPLERILQVVRVQVETAGGGGLRLQALKRDEAQELRRELLLARQQARGGTTATVANAEYATEPPSEAEAEAAAAELEGTLVRSLSTRDLLIAGATSGQIGPAAAILAAIYQFGWQLVPEAWWEMVPWETAEGLLTAEIVVGLIIIGGLIAWGMAIIATVLTFSGFTLRASDDRLFIEYGLLDRKRKSIPIQRVQAVRMEESWLRQPFRLASVHFNSAGASVADAADSGVLFPLMRRSEVSSLLAQSVPQFKADDLTRPHGRLPNRAARRYMIGSSIGWVIFSTFVFIPLNTFFDVEWWVAGSLYFLTPLFLFYGWLSYRDASWEIERDRLLLRWRSVARVTMVTRIPRLQFRRLTRNPLQRRGRLATLHVAVASGVGGGAYSLAHLDDADAEALLADTNVRRMQAKAREDADG